MNGNVTQTQHLCDGPMASGLFPSGYSAADECFDASQYAFFGRDFTQEIEIGGLDEEDDADQEISEDDVTYSLGRAKDVIENYGFALDVGDVEQRKTERSASELADTTELTSSITKLDRTKPESDEGGAASFGSLEAGVVCNSGEAPSQPFDARATPNLVDHANQKLSLDQGVKTSWPNNQQLSASREAGDGPFWSSSYQTQLQKGCWGIDRSSLQSRASLGALVAPQKAHTALQDSSSGHMQMMQARSVQAHLLDQYIQSYPQSHVGVLPSNPSHSNLPFQYSSLGLVMTPLPPPTKWLSQSTRLTPAPGSFSQHFLQDTSLMPPQVVRQYQRPHAPQLNSISSPQVPSNLNSQHMYDVTPPAPQISQKYGESCIAGDSRDLSVCKARPVQQGMSDGAFSSRSSHTMSWQPLRSKYMTVEEIENIVRIQWAATHSSDPYIDDYYHQAVQAKLSSVPPHGRRHFAPSHLRELPSHARAAVEPHAYLQVDALGRVPFSSIRRPRPLLEVDSVAGSGRLTSLKQGEILVSGMPQPKPLGQEPMVAARVAIEDGLCLLLDVDDMDRLLLRSPPPDGGLQLRRRRQLLLEGLAVSLQLVDTTSVETGDCISGCLNRLTWTDLVFLRMISLIKGQKLLTRYLLLLTPGSELVCYVGMAVFRHLRFLFGGVNSDPSSSAVTIRLANATAGLVSSMDLPSLSAYLAAVVSAPEQPPLRPMDSPAGHGATVVLKSVLERATNLLTDRDTAYPMQNRAVWQASFDAFFTLLAKYCTNKYDSIFHSLSMAPPANPVATNTAAAIEMSKEMPVELLRASLPHTNDHQRKLLLEFVQRSMAMSSLPSIPGGDTDAIIAIAQG